MRYQLSLFLSSYTGGLNQATARELQETADAGGQHAPHPTTKCLRSVRKCFLAVWKMFLYCLKKKKILLVWKGFSFHLEKYFLQFGRMLFSVWRDILFSLEEYCFQFGEEENGAFRKAPPALIAFATVPAFTRLPYHCFKRRVLI